jgi:hypothetical protein
MFTWKDTKKTQLGLDDPNIACDIVNNFIIPLSDLFPPKDGGS